MSQALQFSFSFPLKTPDELRVFLKVALGVAFPDHQVCPNHSTPWRAFCDAYFADESIVIWEGSRGFAGKSFMMAALGITEAITLSADVNILGGSGEQSRRVIEAMRRICGFQLFPKHWLAAKHQGEPGNITTQFIHGNTITALMASQASVRGPHPQRLRMDEIDVMQLSLLDAAMGQTMELRGVKPQTLLSSTHQVPDGTMTEIKKRAKLYGYRYHAWCYRETVEPHGWLKPSEIDRKKREVPASMFLTEYDLQEPSYEGRAFMTENIEKMFQRALGEFKGDLREYVELEAPVAGAVYCHGSDWAKKIDKTVHVTLRLDQPKVRVVAFIQCHRRPWPEMAGQLDERIERYGGRAAHDATGIGDVVKALLKRPVEDCILAGSERDQILTDYIAAVEGDEIECPLIEYMYAEHKYCTNEDLFGRKGTGHLPDTVSAMAVAWKIAKMWRATYYAPVGVSQRGSYWLRTQLDDVDDDDEV